MGISINENLPLIEEAQKYIKIEAPIAPAEGKKILISNWSKLNQLDFFDKKYDYFWKRATGLGLLCGEPSGVICLDIDIDQNKNPEIIQTILKQLPPLFSGKIGNPNRPPARFFKYTGERSCKFKNIGIEILSTGNQTIIPPSKHPTFEKYEWIGTPLHQIDMDSLPALPAGFLDYLADLNDKYKPKKNDNEDYDNLNDSLEKGRCRHGSHNVLSSLAFALFKQNYPFDRIISRLIKHDKKYNQGADYSYFVCPTRPWKHKSIEENAKDFLEEMFIRHKQDIVSTNDEKNNSEQEEYFSFFKQTMPEHGKCLLTGSIKYKNEANEWLSIFEPQFLKALKADGYKTDLKPIKIENYLAKYAECLPRKLMLDIPKWDGEDRLDKILRLAPAYNIVALGPDIKEDEYEKTHAIYVNIFKFFCANIFRRIYNPRVQNLALVLASDKQGVGKSTLIYNLFLDTFKHYFGEIDLCDNQKENFQTILGKAICFIDEFDGSNAIDFRVLKKLITAAQAHFRKSYGYEAATYSMRTSFIMAQNENVVFRDPTGNRRYALFRYNYINRNYNDFLNPEQLLAQYYALYEQDYQLSDDAKNWLKETDANETPEDKYSICIDLYKQRMATILINDVAEWVHGTPAIHALISDLVKSHKLSEQVFRSKLRLALLTKKFKDCIRYRNITKN